MKPKPIAIGLTIMAKAGYDPRGAVDFWQRMANQKGAKTPEFLSTHPAPDSRIDDIKSFLPEALKYYRSDNRFQGRRMALLPR